LNLRFIPLYRLGAPSLRIPQEIVFPVPSDFLCEHLLTVKKHFGLDNEKACRMLIDAILTEVLNSEFNNNLYGFCNVKMKWEGTGLGYYGNVDYMFAPSKIQSDDNIDSYILIMQANYEWPISAIPQVVAQAGCLLKKRQAVGKNTPVFAVLTNGADFRFFAIDTDGVVYICKKFLEPEEDGLYNTISSLSEILRWFSWFMNAFKSDSSTEANQDLNNDNIEDSLNRFFGPKIPW
jgi:hypothetical protein